MAPITAVISSSTRVSGAIPTRATGRSASSSAAASHPATVNEVSLYADAGVNVKGAVASLPDDVLGFAAGVAKVGEATRAYDADLRRYAGTDTPIQDNESVFELTYRHQLTPWWALQPDIQFIRHPGAEVALPTNPVKPIPSAVVLGMRSAVLF